MHQVLQQWLSSGTHIRYGAPKHQVFVKEVGNPNAHVDKTLLLLHGFPESSFSYHAILAGMLNTFERIILFDMIGYGFSDKPNEQHYSYSLSEQANVSLAVWEYFNVTGGHVIAHDMGTSVATELVARHVNNKLPSFFTDGFKSFTFTNGSMVLSLAKLRLSQKILLSKYGSFFAGFTNYPIFAQQVRSANGNNNLTEQEIEWMWELNCLQEGDKKSHLSIRYINDRKKFENSRWLPALAKCELPLHLCWGEDDRVARIQMAHYLKNEVCTNATLTVMKGLGHFCQLDKPDKWVEYVSGFYKVL